MQQAGGDGSGGFRRTALTECRDYLAQRRQECCAWILAGSVRSRGGNRRITPWLFLASRRRIHRS
jgi:hypothetical protein